MPKKKQPSPPAKGRGRQPGGPAGKAGKTFARLLAETLSPALADSAADAFAGAPLANLDYPLELEKKDAGLRRFWESHKLAGSPEPVLASPRPRGYRTTSKRSAVFQSGRLSLVLAESRGDKTRKAMFQASTLEPEEHTRLYAFLQDKLNDPVFRLVAGHLNYCIIRGSYAERAVIFNVDTLNGPLVRKLKMLAAHLQALPEPPAGAFIYPDPSGSDYYLEERRPANLLHWKKLYGKGYLAVRHLDRRYHFHPTSFSQVNESMVPLMLERARELLAPAPGERLLDLYCGYGLFSHYLAPSYAEVLGIDAEGPSIRSAVDNKKLNPGSGNTRFVARRITAMSLEEVLPLPSSRPEAVLLDPPRQGAPSEVIETLARREPRKVLHIHCGVDQIPAALKAWRSFGYHVYRVVPLDMFPGSANLEVLTLLAPGKGGIPPAVREEGEV